MSAKHSLARAAGAMSLAVTLTRLTGLIREMTIAGLFRKEITDAFWTAFRVPNILRELLAEGALNSAFVPVFSRVREERGRQAAFQLASAVINGLLLVTGLFTLSILAFSHFFVWSVAGGLPSETLDLAAWLARVMSPFLIGLSISAALMGMANVEGSYFLPAVVPALFNIAMIIGGWFLAPLCGAWGLEPVTGLALGAVIGALAQPLVQWPFALQQGFRHRWVLDLHDPDLRAVMTRLVPALIGVGGTYLNIMADNQIASRFGHGPVSYLSYAFRLWLLPIGLFGVAISTANLAAVARGAVRDNVEALRKTLATSIRLTYLLTVPASFGMAVLGVPIARVIYQRGAFEPEGAVAVGLLLACYAIGMTGFSLVRLYVPTLYALDKAWQPVGISMIVIAAKLMINVLLWVTGLPYAFLALTTGIAALLNAWLLGRSVRRSTGPLRGLGIGKALTVSVAGSLVMAGAVYGAGLLLELGVPGGGTAPTLLRLIAQILVGVACFAPFALFSGLPEAERVRSWMGHLVGR